MPTTDHDIEETGERTSIGDRIGRGMRGLLESDDGAGMGTEAAELPPPGLETPRDEGTVEGWLRTLAHEMRDEFAEVVKREVQSNPIPVLLTGVALGIGAVVLALVILLVVRHLL